MARLKPLGRTKPVGRSEARGVGRRMAVARSLGAHGAWCTHKEADHPHRGLMHGMEMKDKGRRQATPDDDD
eukprot:365491-Chlamydomonas_euryale.AAC.1